MLGNIKLFSLFLLPMTLSLLSLALIPNGVLNTKELGGYFIAAILLLIASGKSFKGHKISLNKLDITIFLFLVVIPSVQILFVSVPMTSLFRSYMNAALYFCIRIITLGSDWKTRLLSFYAAAFIISILHIIISAGQYWKLLESYHPVRIISGMFFNPGPFAIYLCSITILIFSLIHYFRITLNRQMMWISIIIGLCLMAIILQLYSRTAWISVFAGLLLLYHFNRKLPYTFHTRKRVILYASMIGIILIPLGIWFYQMRPGSVDGRRLVWNSTLEMIKSNPVFGVGLGRFKSEYAHFQGFFLSKNEVNMYQFGGYADETNYAFNDFLQLLSEQGIIGAGISIYMIAQCCQLFSSRIATMPYNIRILYRGAVVSVIVFLISGLTSYPFQMLPITAFFWTAIALCNGDPYVINEGRTKERSRRIPGYVLMLLAFTFSYISFEKTRSYLIWQQSREGTVRQEKLFEIYPYLNDDPDFNNYLGHKLYKQKQYLQALKFFRIATLQKFEKDHIYDLGRCLERLGDFRAAEHQYEIIRSSIPQLLKPKFLIAKLYLSEGNLHKFRLKSSEFLISSAHSKNFEVQLMRQEMTSLVQLHRR